MAINLVAKSEHFLFAATDPSFTLVYLRDGIDYVEIICKMFIREVETCLLLHVSNLSVMFTYTYKVEISKETSCPSRVTENISFWIVIASVLSNIYLKVDRCSHHCFQAKTNDAYKIENIQFLNSFVQDH